MSNIAPAGWFLKPLSALADYHNGRAFKPEDWSTNGLPILRIAQINEPNKETDYYDGTDISEKHLIKKGDLIFSWSATLKAVIWKHYDAVLNQHIFKVIERPDVSRRFLQQALENSIDKLAESSHGSTMKHIKKGVLDEFQLAVPPLAEQKKIASILTSVDEVIENTQKQIDKLQDLKKATMNELLTEGIGHTEFKESEVGRIPKSWEVSRIGDHVKEFGQKSKVNDEFEVFTSSAKGLIKQSDYYGENRLTRRDNIGFNIIPEHYITYRSRTDTNQFFFNQNNLHATGLVSKYYPVFTHKNGIEFNHFMTSLLNFHSRKFANEGVGTSQVVLSFNALKFVKLAVPTGDEQLAISEIVLGFEKKLQSMLQKLSRTQALKKSLMQDLLTGKVRVQVN